MAARRAALGCVWVRFLGLVWVRFFWVLWVHWPLSSVSGHLIAVGGHLIAVCWTYTNHMLDYRERSIYGRRFAVLVCWVYAGNLQTIKAGSYYHPLPLSSHAVVFPSLPVANCRFQRTI